ncbi:GMC oxidoreductase [Streptomyces brasiliensis]|uniref:Glucose-methanol-choline oxidoreductase C-terminal domain-containing protein n=1 Tax=Streptomyces brasiliensis TaxID=1954 RepID=A0A917KSR1_9ACTN|nr:GMC oxidoreductase [Streptomyces brasiliensis]GGJ28158.1 hypothetical protein GCM10010121_044320 [Streptomyces brasiliensis]
MQPYSRGTVRLASACPDAAPVVDPRYLSDSRDLDAMVVALNIARETGQRRALAPWRGEEAVPGAGVHDDATLRAHAEAAMESYFHPVGTCRMGSDDMSVVDGDLRVHGFSGLRIADASVMPSIVSGNIDATVYALAERAADLIG